MEMTIGQMKNQLGMATLRKPTKENHSLMVMKEMLIIGQMKSLPGTISHI